MRHEQFFQVLIYHECINTNGFENQKILNISRDIKKEGFDVILESEADQALLRIKENPSIGAYLLNLDQEQDKSLTTIILINELEKRGLEAPLFLIADNSIFEDIDVDIIKKSTGLICLQEDTPSFIAENIIGHLRKYSESIKTPFLGSMIDYADQGEELWTCPGHNGGIYFRKSPIGKVFFEHMGESIFRNDLDNSVVEMGDLLTHEGPAERAEIEAAEIYGADKTYFVLNGTSTSNKVVNGALVSKGDVVLFDRNNHKSNHQGALILAGGIPVYLETIRNAVGLIGPVMPSSLEENFIRESIKNNPLVTDSEAWEKNKPIRLLIIEQCTYDGTIYNVKNLLDRIGHLCEYILFDEAWAGFMKFHPLFKNHFGMGEENLTAEDPGIVATQSTHKQLSGFSQASQIHVKDSHIEGKKGRVEPKRFNEMFMLHASTSPFYPLFASIDVAAQMMKGKNGFFIWDDTIKTGIDIRKKLRQLKDEFIAKKSSDKEAWFFECFVPKKVKDNKGKIVNWEDIPTNELASEQRYWQLNPEDAWHGFKGITEEYVMTDPNKLTLITPGLNLETEAYEDHGIPAPLLAQYLRENNIVPEKNDLNSILFLLTPGVEVSKAGSLISALVKFKKLHDENAPLENVIPLFTSAHSKRYNGVGLRDLCHEMHNFYKAHNVMDLQNEIFKKKHFPEIVMTPQEATEKFTANELDYLPIDKVNNRISATLGLVYPPGIGVIVPGERYSNNAKPILDYFKMFEQNTNKFPGFGFEIQGVFPEQQADGTIKFFTYVIKE
ncbi:Orn/Lys/Arg decarboxylase N-terminal domain-containing protein [Cellulophaga sp. Z1A5H]|uniref:Orn/Lys/Arg family decarboxylase n=1 Tax=Cellulophaga sp. Z1A5H TaxID=2687291 RepID=UPI0013FD9C78|nr:Orn/Lys/Arg decarboxylase N-terminal domain-containing protein [Cellulophaga sp. Z1A5H]